VLDELTETRPKNGRNEGAGRALILLADDDQSIRSLLQSFLEREGFDTVEAKSGRDVIPAINKHRPDVVIMDVRMPGMTGLDVLDQMKRATSTTSPFS
jgi:CheY-like chemotaxis protein